MNPTVVPWYIRVLVRVESVGVRADPVWWSRARRRRGNNFARKRFFLQQFWFARDLGNRYFHGIFPHGNRNPRKPWEKRHFHGKCLDGNGKSNPLRELSFFVTGNQASFGNCLDRTTGTRKKTFPCNPAGNFPSKALLLIVSHQACKDEFRENFRCRKFFFFNTKYVFSFVILLCRCRRCCRCCNVIRS